MSKSLELIKQRIDKTIRCITLLDVLHCQHYTHRGLQSLYFSMTHDLIKLIYCILPLKQSFSSGGKVSTMHCIQESEDRTIYTTALEHIVPGIKFAE